MNREDIIRMAEEAGFQYYLTFTDGDVCIGDECGSLVKFAQLVAAAERQACASIVENWNTPDCGGWDALGMADAIRARNK